MMKSNLRFRVVIALFVIVAMLAGSGLPVFAENADAAAIEAYGYYNGKNAKKIPVITYHRVVSNKDKKKSKYRGSDLAISQGMLEKQMKWLSKNNYRTINCEEFYLWYKGKIKLPPKTVLITFDDGHKGVVKYALPILKKYNLHATSFIIGKSTYKGRKHAIKYKDVIELRKTQNNLEFQSHTYALHTRKGAQSGYKKTKKDALKQKKLYGFDYLAYPYGTNNKAMRKAYKDSGIKLAFAYGNFGYATRSQNIYQIRRIKIYGNGSMAQFTKWFK